MWGFLIEYSSVAASVWKSMIHKGIASKTIYSGCDRFDVGDHIKVCCPSLLCRGLIVIVERTGDIAIFIGIPSGSLCRDRKGGKALPCGAAPAYMAY